MAIICLIYIAFFPFQNEGPDINSLSGVEFKVVPFELRDVKLLDKPFKRVTKLNIAYVISCERNIPVMEEEKCLKLYGKGTSSGYFKEKLYRRQSVEVGFLISRLFPEIIQ